MKKLLLLFTSLVYVAYAYSQASNLDSSFAGKGWTYVDFIKGNFGSEIGRQVLLQDDGSYLVVVEAGKYTMVTRFLSNGKQDKSFGLEGYSEPIVMIGAKAALQKDGKIVLSGTIRNATIRYPLFGLVRYNSNGSLDMTFGNNGIVMTDFFGNDAYAYSITVQDNGKLLVAGTAYNPQTGHYDFALAHYNSDGSLDNSFGGNGIVTTDFTGGNDVASSIAVQKDGKIVASGTADNSVTDTRNFALVRYNSDGSLDQSFGGIGKINVDFGSSSSISSMALQNDNKIVVAGTVYSLNNGERNFALARFNQDGSLDQSFDADGKLITFFETSSDASSMAIQNGSGKIIVAGTTFNPNDDFSDNFAFARYNPNGSLDKSFGNNGLLITHLAGYNTVAFAITLQNNGKWVVAGFADPIPRGYNDMAFARYNEDGSLDNSFGEGGIVFTYLEGEISELHAIAVQKNGNIVVAGKTTDPQTDNSVFAIASYNHNGFQDKSFGRNGMVTTNFSGGDAAAQSVALQADGKIIVVGTSYSFGTINKSGFAIARYHEDGTEDNTFNGTGKVYTELGEYGRGNSVVLQNDGKIVVAGGVNRSIAIGRYNNDGTLDNSFGVNGIVISDIAGYSLDISSVALQNDGKIVAAGRADISNSSRYHFALVRFNGDGSLDNSFGERGIVTTDFGKNSIIKAIIIQDKGKILVSGNTSYSDSGFHADFALARYNADGSLDQSFGEGGKVVIDFGSYEQAEASSMALQSINKIIVAGNADANDKISAFAFARLNTDGSLDKGFGEGGKLIQNNWGGDEKVWDIAIHENRLYAAGSAYDFTQRALLAAFQLEPCTLQVFYQDNDKDGYGNPEQSIQACTAPEGYVAQAGDCNDNNAAIHPGSDNFPNSWLFNKAYSIGIYNNPLTPGCSDDHGLISAPVTGSGGPLYVTTSPAATYSVATRALQLQFDLYAFDAGTDLACATPLVAFKCTTKVKVYIVAGTHTSSARPAATDIYGLTSWITLNPGSNRISVPVTKPLAAGASYRLYVEGENKPCNNMKDQRYVLDHIVVESGVMQESFTGTMPPAGWQLSTMVETGVYNSMATPACADDRGMVTTQVGTGGPAYLASTPAVALSGAATALKVMFDLYAFKLNDQLDCAVMQAALKCSTQLKLYLVRGNYNVTTPPTDADAYGATGWITLQQQANAIIVPITRVLVPGTAYRLYIEVVNSNCSNLPGQRYVIDNISMAEVQNTMGGEICGNGIDDNCNGLADEACSQAATNLQVRAGAKAMESSSRLQVKAVPNPSNSYFTLQLQGRADVPLSIKVLDVTGRVLEVKTGLSSNATLQLGQHYRPGIYLVELTQGKEKVLLKLVKQAD